MVFLLPSAAWATTYYVSKTPGASNGNACTSPGSGACATIGGGLAKLRADGSPGNDELLIQAGLYHEGNLGCDFCGNAIPSGTSWSSFTRIAAFGQDIVEIRGHLGSERTIWLNPSNNRYIEFDHLIFDGQNSNRNVIQFDCPPGADCHHIRIQNSTIRNGRLAELANTGTGHGILGGGAYDIEILNNNFHDNYYGIYGGLHIDDGRNGWLIRGNRFENHAGYGLHIYSDQTPGMAVSNNTIDSNYIINNNREHGIIPPDRQADIGCGAVIASGFNNVFKNNVVIGNRCGLQVYGNFGDTECQSCKALHNTFYRNTGFGIEIGTQAINTEFRNNIFVENAGSLIDNGISTTKSGNLCGLSGSNCNIVANPQFLNGPGGDVRIPVGSPACGAGTTLLAGLVSLDYQGTSRPSPPSSGAFECAMSIPPSPGLQAFWKGAGNANDSSGHGFHATLVNGASALGTPIVGTDTSFALDGVNDYLSVPANIAFEPTDQFCVSMWVNTTEQTAYKYLFDRGGSYGAFISPSVGSNPAGLHGYIVTGGTLIPVSSAGVDLDSGSNLHVVFTKTLANPGLRLYVQAAQVGFTPTTATVSYDGGTSQAFIGRNGGLLQEFFAGRIAHVNFFNEECDQQDVLNLFNINAPSGNLAAAHWRFFQADAAENTTLAGSPENDLSLPVAKTGKVRLRWAIQNGSGATVNRFYGLECNVNGGSFTTLTNSCATNPACIADDTQATMGQATNNLLNLAGLNYVSGRRVVDTINQGLTTNLPNGSGTEWDWTVAFNQALADQDAVSCRPQGLTAYPAVLPVMTLEAPIATPSWVRQGGRATGGMYQ